MTKVNQLLMNSNLRNKTIRSQYRTKMHFLSRNGALKAICVLHNVNDTESEFYQMQPYQQERSTG